MNWLFAYLGRIPKSKNRILIVVLLISMVIALATYLLFQSEWLGSSIRLLGLISIAFYTIWLGVLYGLQRKDRIRLIDLGLSARETVRGLWAGFYIFLGVNLIFLALSLLTTRSVSIAESFRSLDEAGRVVATFIFSILAGAFIEEAIYRAYLIPQFYLRIKARINNSYTSLAIAIVASQLLFALSHLPREIFKTEYASGLANYSFLQLFVGGIIHAVVYLRTRNLIFVTLVHAFLNFSLTVIDTPSSTQLFSLLVTVLIAIGWPYLFPDKNRQFIGKLGV
jgi:uncharacterized protein